MDFLTTSRPSTLCSILVGHVELLQVFVETVCEQNLSTTTLSSLHLHDHLAASHLNLLLLHPLTALLHLLDLLLVARLLSLSLLPLFVGDTGHDLHRLLRLLLLLFHLALFHILDLLVISLALLLLHTGLQPILEGEVTLLLFVDFNESFSLLLSELVLLFECLGDQLALFPLVHAMGTLLVLLVQSGLLEDHLLEQVLLSLEDEHLAQTLLMLLDSQPVVVIDLIFSKLCFALSMHVKHGLVLSTQPGLLVLLLVLEVNLGLSVLITSVLGIDIGLSSLV